jgi:heat shock protein HslJ
MYRLKRHTTTMVAAALLPLAAACGAEQADGGGAPAATETAADRITGVRWSVDSVTADGEKHPFPAGAHLTIGADGTAEGSYGCNDFHAKASVDGDRVRLSDAEATAMACADHSVRDERTLARTLTAGPLGAEVDDGRLTLTTADGDTVRLSERQDTALDGTTWRVTAPGPAGRAHLTFDRKAGTVTGSLGCNRVRAKATVRDGHITVGAPTTTRMMCEDSLMATEKRLTALFDQRVDYRIDQQTLTLTSKNGTTVRAAADQ